MSELSTSRRSYHSPARQKAAAATRERIIDAGAQLVREFTTWNWDELTFRAVAERAEVSERTVYRHFPTERHLHDAIMGRLEDEAGIAYEDVELDNLAEVTARVFASLRRFAIKDTDRHTARTGLRRRRSQTTRCPGPCRCRAAAAGRATPGAGRSARRAVEPDYLRAVGRRVEPRED